MRRMEYFTRFSMSQANGETVMVLHDWEIVAECLLPE
jgi:hypothetical protein